MNAYVENRKNPFNSQITRDSCVVTWHAFNPSAFEMLEFPINVGGGNYHTITDYRYDEDKQLWTPTSRTTRTITSNGKAASVKEEMSQGDKWIISSERIYDYDERGNQTVAKDYSYHNGEVFQFQNSSWLYEYNNKGYITSITTIETAYANHNNKTVFVYYK